MKINSTHKNLNTSYVNLSALLKFLRQQNFVGNVHFETKGYEADIFFTEENELNARENDHFAGRISVGSEVLSHILIRAHEAGGIINVYDESEEKNSANEKTFDEIGQKSSEQEILESSIEPETNSVETAVFEKEPEELPKPKPISLKEKLGLPNLPFSFRKKAKKDPPENIFVETPVVEIQKEEVHLSDWDELLELIGELLQTVEKSLAESNLNFVWVFDKVRTEIFEEYPFLHPNSPVFEYKNGKISMTEQINNNLFIASIAESMRRLLEKFETHPKFAEVHRSIVMNILELMNKRHAQYDKYLMAQQLEKIFE